MKSSIYFIFALIIEFVVLLTILLLLLLGLAGVFLPILPGLFFIGIGAGLYSLLITRGYGKMTPHIHRGVLHLSDKIFTLKITQKIMGLVKIIKKRRQEKVKEEILKNGLILLGFNTALIAAFIFGLTGISALISLFNVSGIISAFIPLLLIFIFAGSAAVMWYRFGQLLGARFKNNKIVNSSLVVLISLLPLLAILLLFSALIGLVGGFLTEIVAIAFLGLILMTVLGAVFELLILSLGVLTTVKK